MTTVSNPQRSDRWKSNFINRFTGEYPAFIDRLNLSVAQTHYLRSLFSVVFDFPLHELVATRVAQSRVPIRALYTRHGAVNLSVQMLTGAERSVYSDIARAAGLGGDAETVSSLDDSAKLMTVVALILGNESAAVEAANSAPVFQAQLDSLNEEYNLEVTGLCSALSMWRYFESGAEIALPWWLNLSETPEITFRWAISSVKD